MKKLDLTFPMLLDPGNKVASDFRLTFTFSSKLQAVYQELGIDLERFNGDPSWSLPMPASYLIDRDGIVRCAAVNPDYTVRPEPEEVLQALGKL